MNSYERPSLGSRSPTLSTKAHSQAHADILSSENEFKYKIDNPSIITKNLGNILFSEEFADVVLVCGGDIQGRSGSGFLTSQ